MLLRDLLNERLSDVVYRYVIASEIINVLEKDKFQLTVAIGSDADNIKNKGKLYYLSTTRSKGGSYHSSPSSAHALLKLDGRLLGQKYSGSAIDYWADGNQSFTMKGMGSSEAEDRIYSNKPSIPNASKYIKEIHYFLGNPKESLGMFDKGDGELKFSDAEKRLIRSSTILAKKRRIPIYFYQDKQDFILMNKKKSVNLDLSKLKRTSDDRKNDNPYVPRGGYTSKRSQMAAWTELLIKKRKSELSDRAKKTLGNVQQSDNYVNSLETDIHNNKQTGSASDKRIVGFMSTMKKLKLNTPKEVIEFIKRKWS